jgi:hypothetical protein
MTDINISEVTSTIVVTESSGRTIVLPVDQVSVVTAVTEGPQGPQGQAFDNLNDVSRVDKSVVYYDSVTSTYRADAIWTTSTLSDGGNF